MAPDQFALTLDGRLPHDPIPLPPDGQITELFRSVVEPIVLGESRDREKLTLIDAEGSVPTIPGDVRTTSWRPTAVLVGQHVEEPEALVFDAMRCGFDYLRDWALPGSLSHSVSINQTTGRTAGVEIGAGVETIGASPLNGVTAELVAEPRWTAGDHHAEIEMRVWFRLEAREGVAWRDALDSWLRPLRNVVSLASLRPARIAQVDMRIAGMDAGWAELLLQWTDLARPPRTERSLIPQDVLFTARELPGGFADGLRRWFEIHGRHSTVVELLLGVGYAPFIFSEQRFLALAQAIEVYHREAIGGAPLPRTEHRRRVSEITSAVTDPYLASWAEPILREANRLRLAERVVGVMGRLGDLGREIVGDDEETFVRRVVQTRNHLTHRDQRGAEVLKEPARYWHGQALDWLLRASLLLDLGFGIEEVGRRIRRNTRYGWFRSQLMGG